MAEKRKYEGWQYIGRIMAPLIYLFCLILLFRPERISNDIQHQWFVVLVGCVTGTIALIGGYYWEEVALSVDSIVWTRGIGRIYEKTMEIPADDIITVYGIDRNTKSIYIITRSYRRWIVFLKDWIPDMEQFKEIVGNKSGGKEEFINATKTKKGWTKSDIEAIRRLP